VRQLFFALTLSRSSKKRRHPFLRQPQNSSVARL